MKQYQSEYELGKSIARETGMMLRQQVRKKIDSQEKRDIKLKLDRDAETLIIDRIRAHSDYTILSEESGLSGKLDEKEPYWIVDPIDGTMNFSRDFPFACVSIAFWKSHEPIFGVVYDFYRDELFSGMIGEGAFLNGVSTKPSGVTEKSQAIVATGISTYMELDNPLIKKFTELVFSYKKIRMIGSAALSLCYIATGRVDSYFEENIKIWDIAAGIAICKSVSVPVQIAYKENFNTTTKVGI